MAPNYRLPDDNFAVLLNANAGRVTPRLTRAIREVVPQGRLFLTESPEDARQVLTHCVEDEVNTVFAGGGDGTIVDVINTLADLQRDADHVPAVGVLRLGTGNALAHWMKSRNPVGDLRRWRAGKVHRAVPVQMVTTEGTLFPFAGLGYDAAILNDYTWLKGRAAGTWWESLARGIPGYLLAGYLRTLPNYLRRKPPTVTITNLGAPARKIGVDGRELGQAVAAGDVIYRGPATMIGSASTPFYGGGLKMFPHATNRAGRFQLRICAMSPWQAARLIPELWRGTAQHEALQDWYVDRVRMVFDDAMPFQLGGDPRGYRRELTFSLARFPTTLVGQA
ncbi:MAG: diacylglycerol kinase [Oligoflexia bacterium]|nr:diacylglycerol kinase [Oligoflexia bacterium]